MSCTQQALRAGDAHFPAQPAGCRPVDLKTGNEKLERADEGGAGGQKGEGRHDPQDRQAHAVMTHHAPRPGQQNDDWHAAAQAEPLDQTVRNGRARTPQQVRRLRSGRGVEGRIVRIEAPQGDPDRYGEDQQDEPKKLHAACAQGTAQFWCHVPVMRVADDVAHCTGRSAERGQVSSPRRFSGLRLIKFTLNYSRQGTEYRGKIKEKWRNASRSSPSPRQNDAHRGFLASMWA